ncbi:caspase-4-like isoform X3 [Dipodomys merriami]|uniref:caspase-4-like isoform X3 n=1 Tax=Dipodomys merriami TaxID=94247 RepID=UPI003855B1AB
MAENNFKKNPFKMAEVVGKNILTGFLENLVQNNKVKLEEQDKETFNNAEWRDKRWVFVDALQRNPDIITRQVLRETILKEKPKGNDVNVRPITKTQPAESAGSDVLQLCPREKFLRLSAEMADEIYPIKERTGRTRQALIICNIKFDHHSLRYGAEIDIRGMERLLEDLGYTVTVERNLKAMDMESVLRAFADRPEHNYSDSTFLVLMSHGTPHGICGTMHSDKTPDVLFYDTIYQIFNTCNCRGLRDKPKVIIVQACRGDNLSYRDPTYGSPFITELIRCFQKYSCSRHIVQIFQKVQQSFENPTTKAQLPSIEQITLTRDFYLFPGN